MSALAARGGRYLIMACGLAAHASCGSPRPRAEVRLGAAPPRPVAAEDGSIADASRAGAVLVRAGGAATRAVMASGAVRCWPHAGAASDEPWRSARHLAMDAERVCALVGDHVLCRHTRGAWPGGPREPHRVAVRRGSIALAFTSEPSLGWWGGLTVLHRDATKIVATDAATCALRRSGRVVCWGDGDRGELGRIVGASATPIPIDLTP